MEVIVGEDQLSLAIGKKGQNVRLATRLVGWEIKIVSEEILKKEIAQQMGKMMASGEAVPITALEGVTTPQAETLADKGIEDVEALAATSVDDLVEFLDVSLDEAEAIKAAAGSIVEARNAEVGTPEGEETAEPAAAEAEVETAAETETPAEAEPETAEPEPAETETAVAKEASSQDAETEEAVSEGAEEGAPSESAESTEESAESNRADEKEKERRLGIKPCFLTLRYDRSEFIKYGDW